MSFMGYSLAVQWFRFNTSNARDVNLTPGWGTRILPAAWYSQKIKLQFVVMIDIIFKKIKKEEFYGIWGNFDYM